MGPSRLTSAEKQLGDAVHRLQRPAGPTCARPPIASDKPRTKKRPSRQGRPPSGCTSRRARSPANDPSAGGRGPRRQFMPTHCAAAADAKNDEGPARGERGAARMRGGAGGGTEPPAAGLFSADNDFTWYNSRFALPSARLEGGGGAQQQQQQQQQAYPAAGCGKALAGRQRNSIFQNNFDMNYLQLDSINPEYLAANKCKLRHIEENAKPKPECSCPAKDHLESVLKRKSQAICRKKPCMGTDCLIKAFKDAQDFVDSIGKVPGLAGLGITESPYFNKPQEPREIKKADAKAVSSSKQPDISSNLCNIQNIENLKKSNYSAMSNAFTSNATKKSGVVQEAITSFPDPSTYASLKSKKKDEKLDKLKEVEILPPPQVVEETPCGEPKCKSRPKKKISAEEEESPEKAESLQKPSNAQKSDKKVSSRARSHSNPGGDKAVKSKKSQFDYSYGNMYPTSVYGHKKCNLLRRRVPAHMGWMWNQIDPIGKLKPRTGWRPGAISLTLRELLKEAREGFFKEARRPMSLPRLGGKKSKAQKTMSYTGMKKSTCEEEAEEDIEFPPTLHVHRKDGTYYVTMYPIRQDTSGVPRLDEPMNPLQFKIVKSKDSLASSSTASDMEIEFSPPAAVNRLKKKPNVVHIETQVKQQEILDAFKKPSSGKKKSKDGKEKSQKGKKK